MDRVKLVNQDDLKFRLNTSVCHLPLCFPNGRKIESFSIGRNNKYSLMISKGKGYIGWAYRTPEGSGSALGIPKSLADEIEGSPLPTAFDLKVILGLTAIAIKNPSHKASFRSSYAMLKALDLPTNNPEYYNMVWDSIHKWSITSLFFRGTVRVQEGYGIDKRITKTLSVNGVISGVDSTLEDDSEDGSIEIHFTEHFLILLKNELSSIGSYNTIKKLRGHIAPSLYKYLIGWDFLLKTEGKELKRELGKFYTTVIGMEKADKFNRMKKALETAIGSINSSLLCGGKYKVDFIKNKGTGRINVVFNYYM